MKQRILSEAQNAQEATHVRQSLVQQDFVQSYHMHCRSNKIQLGSGRSSVMILNFVKTHH